MAQKTSTSTQSTSSTAAQTKKRPAASEIDDIFSKKSKPASTVDTTTTASGKETKNSKNKKGKGKAESEVKEVETKTEEKVIQQEKKRVPETVVDNSKVIESYKPVSTQAVTKKAKDMTEEEKKAAEEEQKFMDSRGTRKKTEDGLPIYDTSELKIGLGGDTELCPFDCECCF